MRKNHFFGLFILITFSLVATIPLFAQQINEAPRNSVINLSATGDFSAYQWEISSDKSCWYDIAGATSKIYSHKLTAPAYLRVKQTAANLGISYSEVYELKFETKNFLKTIKSSGGQGYAETNGKPASGINIREDRGPDNKLMLTAYSDGWTNTNASLTWYLYHTAGKYDIDLLHKITKSAKQQFQFSIIDINNTGLQASQSIISTTGTGNNETLTVLSVDIPKTGFYKYELKPLSPPNNKVTISGLEFKSMTSAAADVHATNYLSSPSVHLSSWRSTDGTSIPGKKYDWCYMEILVPTGGDALSTYYMSLGVLAGYMGIQTNSNSERGVIFSMWDDGDTDTDPTLDQFKRAGAVDNDPKTTVSRFGNEGTGTKSFVHGWNWDTNVPVKFLTNARLEEYKDTMKNVAGADSIILRRNTLVSAWFNANPDKGWQYISTLRLPNKVSYFDSWYSFLENYGYQNGQIKRHAYYYNAFAHEQSYDPAKPGRWMSFNQVNFSNTDGSTGQRMDFEQGRLPENPYYFYMSSGGYANATVKKENTTTLQADKLIVESLDLEQFLNRVDEAVAKERAKNDSIKNLTNNLANKSGWTIESFSSQEVSGEGAVNGRAAATIDGDPTTYWHSRWQGTTASFPHHIAVNMNKTENVTGFLFKLSGGTNRHMKEIELWGSTDGGTYILMESKTMNDAEQIYVALSQTWEISKFKLVIKSSQTGEVHCRINEIDVTVDKKNETGIVTSHSTNSKFNVYPNPAKNRLNYTLPSDANDIQLTIMDVNGKEIFSEYVGQIKANDKKQIAIPATLNDGVYIIQLKDKGTTRYNQTFFVKRN